MNFPSLTSSSYSFVFFSWVDGGWVDEFTISVLVGQVGNDGLSNLDEVGDVDGVGDVGVEVILEVLEHIHVLLDELISSDSWE